MNSENANFLEAPKEIVISVLGGVTQVEAPARFTNANIWADSKIGAFSYANGATVLSATIGRFCSIAHDVLIGPGSHPINWLSTHPFVYDKLDEASALSNQYPAYGDMIGSKAVRTHEMFREVVIGHDVWIGAKSIIMGGVKIGHGAIIGAGSVVTQDVPEYAIVGGVPARIIRYRFDIDVCKRLIESQWWLYDLTDLRNIIDYSQVENALDLIEACKKNGNINIISPLTFSFAASGDVQPCLPISWPSINFFARGCEDIAIPRDKFTDLARAESIELEIANYKTRAVQIVLASSLASSTRFGFNKRKFQRLIAEASSLIPNDGPASIQHTVLLDEARRVISSKR